MVPHVDFNEDATDGEGIESETECYDYESDSDIDDYDSEPEGDVEEVKATQLESPRSSDEDSITDGSDVSNFPVVVKKRSKGVSMPKKLHLVGAHYKYRIVILNMAAKT